MPPMSYASLFPCAIAGLLGFLGELLKPAPEDRKFAFFQDVGKMLLHIAGGTVSRSVARKILKAVFDALKLPRATSVAEKASYLVALCFMLEVIHTTEKKAAGFLSLFHVLSVSLGIVDQGQLFRAENDDVDFFPGLYFTPILILFMRVLFDAALDAAGKATIFQIIVGRAFSWVFILVPSVAVILFLDRKLKVYFPNPSPLLNESRDETTLFTYINHKFGYAKNLKINYTRMRDEAEKLYTRRDDYNHEANKDRGKQLKKEYKIWIEEVGRIEAEMRELESKYKNHRSAWHLFWSHSKLSKKFVHMWAKLRSTQEDGKFERGIMVEKLPERVKKLHGPSQRERDDDFWIQSTNKSEDSKSRVQEARKLSGGDTSKTNESGKSVAASLTQDTLGNESTDRFLTLTENTDGNRVTKYAFGLKEPPDAREWHDANSIELTYNIFSNLPDKPVCSQLLQLDLKSNYKLRKIPPAFFTNMPSLLLLDLSNTSIMVLPKSLFELPSLGYLYLKNCEFLMVLPPEVGKLKRLEVLDMEGTEITNLPIEIKELSDLRALRVSFDGCLDHSGKSSSQSNEIISSGLISALFQLEKLSIDVNPDDKRWDTCVEHILNEVCGLARLSHLRLYIPRVEILSRLDWDHYAATRIYHSKFKLIVGGHSKRIISRLPSNVELKLNTRYRCLKYINGEGVPDVIKKVLQHATTFHLDRHMTAKKLTEFGIENMASLKYCVLGECNEMQVIIDGNDVYNHQIVPGSSGDKRIGLKLLEFLYIYYMKNLKSIWDGPVDEWSLSLLKSLSLSTCPQLITIFTVELLENLPYLQNLTVRDCPAIKSLVSCEEGVKQSSSYLPELRTISLHYVPNLVSISNEVCIAPKLESLSLYNCPKLKSLSIKEVSSKHLTKITGETDWWEALELTQVQHEKFDHIFISINEEGPTGEFCYRRMASKGDSTIRPRRTSVDGRVSVCTVDRTFDKMSMLEGDGDAICDNADRNSSLVGRELEDDMLGLKQVDEMDLRGKAGQPIGIPKTVKTQGETISKGHKNNDLMLNLQLGIRHSVGRPAPAASLDLKASAFDPREKVWTRFPSEGSKYTPPHQSVEFKWKDYCPVVFRTLRKLFKVDAADYMISICGDDALRELSSPGKSGSFFYLTNDDRYMIKTIKKSEVKVLLRMLSAYYNHVRAFENTLVTKFYGLHCVKLTGIQKKVRFIIMGNLFCSEYTIHKRYDLKGSSLGRSTDKPDADVDANTILKDLDLNFIFRLQKTWFQEFRRQIDRDCELLEQERIMDYSLLVGLHFVESSNSGDLIPSGALTPTDEPENESAPRLSRADVDQLLLDPTRGVSIRLGLNMPAKAERTVRRNEFDAQLIGEPTGEYYDVVMFFGIIDILQEYDINKKLEQAYKSIQYGPTSISAVDPRQYSKRFRDFVCNCFHEDT